MDAVKELKDELGKAFGEFKAVNEQREREVKALNYETAETKAKLDKINGALDSISQKISEIEKVKGRMDQLETTMKKPPMGDGKEGQPSETKSLFLEWCRKGILTPEKVKALSVGDDSQGGYLAPKEYVAEIIKGIVDFSPIRTVARVRTTSFRSVQVPKRTGTFAASWVAETGTRSETTGLKYGLEEIPNHEMYALAKVSFAELEDAAFNLEEELRMEFAEQFAVAEGIAFVSGSGAGRPEGILSSAGISIVNSGSASALTGDGVLKLSKAVKSGYARNGSWLLNRNTLYDIRMLKDSNGQYLWQPGLAGSLPNTIDGQPYVECPDMPDVAANAKPIAFGDFRRGYLIVDRLEIAVTRDPYTSKNQGVVEFSARKRVGGQVVLAEAIKIQKVAA